MDQVFAGELAPGDRPPSGLSFHQKLDDICCLETDSTFANETCTRGAERNRHLIAPDGFLLDRSKWKIAYVHSEKTAKEDGSSDNILYGDLDSIWHSVWSTDHTPNPHRVVIDLGLNVTAAGVRLTPRQGDRPAKVKAFKVFLSMWAFGTISNN